MPNATSSPAFAPSLPPTAHGFSATSISTHTQLRYGKGHCQFAPLRRSIIPHPPLTNRRRNAFAPQACAAVQPSKSRSPFSPTSPAETLYSAYNHPIPSGTAALALDRGVPMTDISAAYGHILAGNIRADVPVEINSSLLCDAAYKGLIAEQLTKVDTARLSILVSKACAPTESDTAKLSDTEIEELSTLYGGMIAATLRLSAFELDAAPLRDAIAAHLADEKAPFPMDREAYDGAFAKLQECATEVQGTAAVDTADEYFKNVLMMSEDAHDVQGDGYIVVVDHERTGPLPADAKLVLPDDKIATVLRARLLDGRCIIDGDVPDDHKEGVLLNLENIPLALSGVFVDRCPGDTFTVFYHPYSAHEVLPMLLTPDQIPPQTGLVLDVHILSVL